MGRELGTNARAEPVASDEQLGAFAATVGKMHAHGAAILLDAVEGMAEMIMLPIDCLQQHLPQPIHEVRICSIGFSAMTFPFWSKVMRL